MLSILPLWISLNVYAFLLDTLAIACGMSAWFLFASKHPVFGALLVAAGCGLLFIAIKVHLSYPAKIKAYRVLYQRNLKELHTSSFYDFMGSPCYRMVVRAVLARTGNSGAYPEIYREIWGSGMPCCAPKLATVTIFENAEEGAKWLQAHSRHLNSEPQDDSTLPDIDSTESDK